MRTQGFTLVELMVVVLMMAILATAAIPQRTSVEPEHLEAAAVEVRAALRYAREEALHRNAPVLVDMETQTNTVRVLWGTCTTPKWLLTDPRSGRGWAVDLQQSPLTRAITLTAQVKVANGSTYRGLVFDANGAISEACEVSAKNDKGTPVVGSRVVLSLDGREQVLTLWPATGRVSGP